MKSITLLAAVLFSTIGFSQTKVRGVVRDDSGQGIPMANVLIVDSYDGTTTAVDGSFEFTTAEKGERMLMVKFMGFKDYQQVVSLSQTTVSVDITLKEQVNELNAITISAGAFTASDEARKTVFRAVDIATTAGATADIAGALNTLPGTQKVGESGRLFVRGGDGNETKTFIDGLAVLDAYSPSAPNTPSRGRFLPFMFKGTSFSTGGYSAEFGQALSSALVLDSRDKTDVSRTDIGLLSVGGDVAHTQAWESGSIAGKIQYTNIRPYFGMINQEIDWINAPVSIEGSTAFRQKIGENGMIKFFGNFNNSDFSLFNHSVDDYNEKTSFDLSNRYRYGNAFFKNAINSDWMIRGGASYTSINNDIISGDKKISDYERGVHSKIVLDGSLSEQMELKSGVEIISREHTYDIAEVNRQQFNETVTSAFTEAQIFATNSFVTRVGARGEYNSLNKTVAVDPRVSLAYKTGDNSQMSFAFGTFRQSAKNQFVRANHNLKQETAQHFILNYQRVEENKTFRVEGYYKTYDNLIKYNQESLNNNGYGYARGIELFWRDNQSFSNTDYWISYSFLDTKRNYLNFSESSVPTFASQHNFSAVYKYFVKSLRSQLGWTYSFASGRPYNDPSDVRVNSRRTPAYHDLSFNWSYLPKPYLIIYFSCTNLTGHDNIFGYEYGNVLNDTGDYNRRAIRQPAPRFVFLGIFLTLSKEKSVNQLPTL